MKKIAILVSLALTAATAAFAQTAPTDTAKTKKDSLTVKVVKIPHMRFKGVEIEGNVELFKRELEKKGFRNAPRYAEDNAKSKEDCLKGPFSGKEVVILVGTTPVSRTAFSVHAYFNLRTNWEEAYEDYALFKKHLTSVYGAYSNSTESFYSPYIRGDGYSIKALSEGKCKYETIWHTFEGYIHEEIIYNNGYAQLTISYIDALGLDTNEKEHAVIIEQDL